MALRDLFGGAASLLLMLAKIILVLLFVPIDRLSAASSGRGSGASDERMRVLEI